MQIQATKIKLALIIISFFSIYSCGNKNHKNPTRQKQVVMSEKNPLMSGQKGTENGIKFDENSILKGSIEKDSVISEEKGFVVLQKTAQGHLFLMSQAIIQSAPTPSGRAQANKLVFFKKQGEMLNMFQSTKGQVSTESIKTMILIAEFPIISENETVIKFDFRKGMNTLFQKGSYYISADKTSGNEIALKITHSYLNKVELRGKHLYIDQMIRFNKTSKGTTSNAPAQVKYVFSSYTPNPSFKPKVTDGMKRVGYFENHKVITAGSGEENVYIMKFDMSKVHTYYLTSDIPAEFKAAVIDGIKYWNKVFGKEVFDVKDLPENIDVHEPNYNIIKWMKWDTAGFAYANMMSDPLTGETLQANVYMTSVFGLGGLKRAKKIVEKLKKLSKLPKTSPTARVVLNSHAHTSQKVCDTHDYQEIINADFIKSVEKIDNLKVADEEKEKIYLRFAQDYIREVVAHEVGHTLGLRHNFAGNLKSTITPENFNQIREDYLLKDKVDSKMIPASTVMDYTPGVLASLLGAFIRKNADGLSYDKQAIKFGYTDAKADDMKIDVFCSDTVARATKTHVDCRLFDQFPNIITSKYFTYQELYKDLSLKLISKLDFLKKEDSSDFSKELSKLRFTPELDAISLLKDGFVPFLESITKKAKYLNLEYLYPKQKSVFDKEEIAKANQLFKEESLKTIGGLSNSVFKDFKAMNTKEGVVFINLVNKLQSLTFGLLVSNYKEELTKLEEAQKQEILAKMMRYFERFEKEVIFHTLTVLDQMDFYKKEANFEKDIFEVIAPLIITKSKITQFVSPNKYEVKFPRFLLKKDGKEVIKSLAIKVLMKDYFPLSGSYIRRMTGARQFILSDFLKEQEAAIEGIEAKDINDELYDWVYLEMMKYIPMKNLFPKAPANKKESAIDKIFQTLFEV